MVDFAALTGRLDAAVEDHLGDPAVYRPADGREPFDVRVFFEDPASATRLQGAAFVQSRPMIEVRRASVGDAAKGDVVVLASGRAWRFVAKPERTGDGLWYRGEVEKALV